LERGATLRKAAGSAKKRKRKPNPRSFGGNNRTVGSAAKIRCVFDGATGNKSISHQGQVGSCPLRTMLVWVGGKHIKKNLSREKRKKKKITALKTENTDKGKRRKQDQIGERPHGLVLGTISLWGREGEGLATPQPQAGRSGELKKKNQKKKNPCLLQVDKEHRHPGLEGGGEITTRTIKGQAGGRGCPGGPS